MDNPVLDVMCFTKLLENDLPELLDLAAITEMIDINDIMAWTGYIRIWKDMQSSLEDALSWAKMVGEENDKPSLVLCPAGGHSSEFIRLFEQNKIHVQGFIDTNKANNQDEHKGYPLYPLTEKTLKRFDRVLITSPGHSDAIMETMVSCQRGKGPDIHVPFLKEPFDRDFCEKSIAKINDICLANKGRVVVYAVDRLYFHNVKRVKAMTENGIKVILITPDPLIHHSHPLYSVSEVFEWICCTQNSELGLLFILNRIMPDIIHLSPVARHYESAVLMHAVSKVPVVCEFYDILLSLHTHEDYVSLFGKNAADLQFFCEYYLCNQADGIMYKSSDDEGHRLLSYYNSDRPGLQFQNYIAKNDGRESPSWDGKRRLRIVYSGSVHAQGIQNHGSSLLDIIPAITGQNVSFDIYNVHDSGDNQYGDYRKAANENPLFGYHLAVKNSDIVSCLSEYDIGWQVIDIQHSKQNLQHFKTAINAKFFDYISAGLPMVVSEEYGYMADLVREYDIGVVIRHENLKDLPNILATVDINTLKGNVVAFRNQWGMERHIHRLIVFYTSFMRQPHRQKEPAENHPLAS